jgi:hypothetical protein
MDPDVKYRVSTGNVIVSILLIETAIVPIILVGWYLWEPVCFKEKERKSND